MKRFITETEAKHGHTVKEACSYSSASSAKSSVLGKLLDTGSTEHRLRKVKHEISQMLDSTSVGTEKLQVEMKWKP